MLEQIEACLARRHFGLEVLAVTQLLGMSIEFLEPGMQLS
jgi:hypothetical protein